MTREQFETALDAGTLETLIRGREPKWYRVRRNGQTKTWKRDPERFEIPVKFRFKDCMRVKSEHFHDHTVNEWFRIRETTP